MHFDEQIRHSLPPRSQADADSAMCSRCWPRLKPAGKTDIAAQPRPSRGDAPAPLAGDGVQRPAGRPAAGPCDALLRLRHRGHDVILFHVLDEAEAKFPFTGMVELEDPETGEQIQVDADGLRADYLDELDAFRGEYRRECFQSGIDYVALDTSVPFDRALTEYLVHRRSRG